MKRSTMLACVGFTSAMAAVGILAAFIPGVANAHERAEYDGYCYQKKSEAAADGATAGAIAGAVIGSQVADRGDRGAGAAVGAVAGAAAGAEAGRHSVKCYEGAYYVFYDGYAPPPPPPPGYTVVFYSSRPPGLVYRPIYVAPRGVGYRAGYRRGYYEGRHPYHAF